MEVPVGSRSISTISEPPQYHSGFHMTVQIKRTGKNLYYKYCKFLTVSLLNFHFKKLINTIKALEIIF